MTWRRFKDVQNWNMARDSCQCLLDRWMILPSMTGSTQQKRVPIISNNSLQPFSTCLVSPRTQKLQDGWDTRESSAPEMSKFTAAMNFFLVWTTAVYSAFVLCETTTTTRTTAGFALRNPSLSAHGVEGERQLYKDTIGIRLCRPFRRRLLPSSLLRSTTRGEVVSMALPSRYNSAVTEFCLFGNGCNTVMTLVISKII